MTALSPILSGALPRINPATEPAAIRNGGPEAEKAYQEALGFEDILVNQLSQELASTVSSSDDSADGSSTGGLLGSDPSTSGFASMIPQALSTGIMSAGGLGIAARLAQAIDPSIGQHGAHK
jgi:Rod binding domain-containing protein